jgi:long-chain acyl-CoA synthetase
MTYGELVDRIGRAGRVFADRYAVRPGDRVALISPNCADYLEIVTAVSDLGAMTVAINPKLSGAEVGAILEDCTPRLVVIAEGVETPAFCERYAVVSLDMYRQHVSAAAACPAQDAAVEDEPFVIHYTSGTTGKPKGVMVSHRSRVLSFLGMASEYGCYGPEDHFLAVAPLCHGAGLTFALASLYTGGTVTLVDRFDPEIVVRTLAGGDITGIFLVPTHFQHIFALDESLITSLSSHRLRALISNAAPLLQADKEHVIDIFGEGVLYECYGATESGIITNLRPHLHLQKRDCVGSPFLATEVRLLDEAGRECAVDEVGELFSKSPYLFSGYWSNPRETQAAWRGEWVSVGDLARRDADGCYYIVGRKKDMIISGGINIYPKSIEDEIGKLAGVAEVAVVGLPDAKWGEIVHAEIVPAAGATILPDEVSDHCRRTLSRYCVPKSVEIVGRLPKNVGGKILKRQIRELRSREV